MILRQGNNRRIKNLTNGMPIRTPHHESREQRATSELSRPSRRSAPSASRRTGGWLLPVLAAAIIFAPPFAPTAEAQTTLVSNVGQTRSGGLGLDTHEGAQAFTTGDNSAGYGTVKLSSLAAFSPPAATAKSLILSL